MEKLIFPYGFELLENRRVFAFPAITITLKKENSPKEFSFLVLVDSGAEFSLFTKGDAELLEIDLQKGEKVNIGGVTGDKFLAFIHFVLIKIGNKEFKIKTAFSSRNDTPRILGRNPLFSNFFIIFDHQKQNTIFIPRGVKSFEKLLYA
ncbi:hypothetical protein COX74_01080 [bacterium (Candidatus Gribaldobacteria) CG_4_10_14_0_2_um_filter_41_16]|uniref:Peptidase A2 domain-containing protein n=4 Tax=Candidatus Gribaldobacteria TaxID=2798536 RepID=A0A2M7VIT2_9BACT|nr:MAG: hypothetical protein AUJ36_03295 [Parcubacteria group bacterium CG1_02_41_26]PIR91232.1 MAG: hypothetical protein COU03_02685 [bacterium (Candidatus Gribaldobacteria) CG10_big_fil_rev_8_21_14_0_10_41_12]PIV47321.1 MAG: hypothetical protein COS21_00520 [bacterium (Candidatus Gribaldobacteria) CG02_land_8_20_14_3_00_41_15]PIX02884.1 MAG: hypothetical protein COZ78_03365 [bacterium (Candidatus Gribaldobacteria) CG_4_8_14_3_um_filter_42_11]PJA01757.1 MAG: hypothetical protein COX74_01080 [b